MPPSSDFRPGLRPPQFSLRTLLLLVTLCGVIFSLMNVLPPLATAGLVFAIVCVFAHVAGNAIGTSLRDSSSRSADADGVSLGRSASQRQGGKPHFAPQTQLSQRQPLGWPVLAATGTGFFTGAIGGGLWTAFFSGARVGELNIAVGVAAFGVLGGFAAFLTFSFVQVGTGALRQALRGSRPSADDGAA